MSEYKNIKIKQFRKEIDKILKRKFPSKAVRDPIRDEIQSIIASEGGELFGKMCYIVLKKLEEDIDDFCDRLFFDLSPNVLKEPGKDDSKLAAFLVPYTRTESEISEAALIDNARFSRIKNNLFPDMYAYEVYGLAKAFDLKPSQLFEYFYGDGKRPVVGV